MTQGTQDGHSRFRQLVRVVARSPGVRLVAPGWPDAGRRIVQTPALEALLARAIGDRPAPAVGLNAGVGEGLYSPMLRRFAPGARLLEFDFAAPAKKHGRSRTSLQSLAHRDSGSQRIGGPGDLH